MSDFNNDWVRHIHFSSTFETVLSGGRGNEDAEWCWCLTNKDYDVIESAAIFTNFEENETLTTLGVYTDDVIPPGFTLSLEIIYKCEHKDIVLNFFKKSTIFILLFSANGSYRSLSECAVITQVEEVIPELNDTSVTGVVTINTKGRQRCEVVSYTVSRKIIRSQLVTVKVLPEPSISYFPRDVMHWSPKHMCQTRLECLTQNCNYRRYNLAQYPLNGWFYNQNEAIYLVKQITDLLSPFYNNLPTDPMLLSFWFVRYFPQTRREQVEIMKLKSWFQRLRVELNRLKMELLIRCRKCKKDIAQDKVITIRCTRCCNDGSCSNVTCRMIRIFNAKNFHYNFGNQDRTERHSGLAYSYGIECVSCGTHLGYQYVLSNPRPYCFYELNKENIDILTR